MPRYKHSEATFCNPRLRKKYEEVGNGQSLATLFPHMVFPPTQQLFHSEMKKSEKREMTVSLPVFSNTSYSFQLSKSKIILRHGCILNGESHPVWLDFLIFNKDPFLRSSRSDAAKKKRRAEEECTLVRARTGCDQNDRGCLSA
jgi:hypothetical protein